MENLEHIKTPWIIGLTGGIGSGKSTVAREFAKLGVPVFYSDDYAKTAYFDPEIKRKIIELLGEQAYLSDSEINKTVLREAIFTNEALKFEIESMIHPFVRKGFDDFLEKNRASKYIINESALLFEKKLASKFTKIILVSADLKLREQRVIKRDNISKESFEKIVSSQMAENEKMLLADYVIINDLIDSLPSKVIKVNELLINSIG